MSTKRKTPTKLAAPAIKQGAKPALKSRLDQSRTLVSAGKSVSDRGIPAHEIVEIPSDSSSDDDASDDDGEENKATANPKTAAPASQTLETTTGRPPKSSAKSKLPNGDAAADAKRSTADDPSASDSEPQSPTFGELARSRIVDVQAQLNQQQQQAQTPGSSVALAAPQALAPPSLQSLGTVLTQALRSDDTELLESCLQTTDLNVVRATVQRLDSSLAEALLTRLASRLHRRPGRASTLLGWIQWTLIAHGGALAAQPDLQRKLGELNRVLEERARGLNSLLVLKGKLDMLEAQMQLRRSAGAGRHGAGAPNGAAGYLGFGDEDEADAEDDRNVVYVEGQEDATKGGVEGFGADDQFDISAINGVDSDSDDDEDDEDDADDYQRGDAVEESLDDDEVDFDDVDESGDDESEVEAAPPAKVQKTSDKLPKRR
ncbi:hypothetical protein GGTG_02276 [Gaeumannomyces tritici R3-111a-1]|uniref:Small-subunit processome Utp12 domain-containing protein n=1 Tax=Gaeumannomyces tritici (strain R3-111a-1) TaxID=644352 RepID=J3NLX1_GAET3|nr:hypothetical protein GGTG_02276 [Gaeumannomyces tritici R3-111a-1]EJT82302.1 hypothetical protein GGTG_02276 [Gaeumannomyces tritici R3-111a-1]